MICINYIPISLLSIYSKIFEKLIYSRMYYFLNKNNLIYEKQFGFRAKHSVNHALISTTELIKDKLNMVILLPEYSSTWRKCSIQLIMKS